MTPDLYSAAEFARDLLGVTLLLVLLYLPIGRKR